jgi:hypothetical protein
MNLGDRRITEVPLGLELDSRQCIPEIVTQAVCFYYDTPPGMLSTQVRKREITDVRHMIHYFLTINRGLSLKDIGKVTDRDHATVHTSRIRIEGYFPVYPKTREAIHVIAFYINWLTQLDMEIKKQSTVTVQQIRYMYLLLDSLGIRHMKEDMVSDASGGRTESVRDLTNYEMVDLTRHLESKLKGAREDAMPHKKDISGAERMRKRILSMCYSMGWTRFDPDKGRHTVDYERLEAWLLKYGYLHKPLDKYRYLELPTLVTQMENLMRTALGDRVKPGKS